MGTSTYELRCRECGKTWGNQPRSICEDCFSPLEVTYDYDSIRPRISRDLLDRNDENHYPVVPLRIAASNFSPNSASSSAARSETAQ